MLCLATEILKLQGSIYGHQWAQSVKDLRLEDEDTQGVLTANTFRELLKSWPFRGVFTAREVDVDVETELGSGCNMNKMKMAKWSIMNKIKMIIVKCKTNGKKTKWSKMNCQIMECTC